MSKKELDFGKLETKLKVKKTETVNTEKAVQLIHDEKPVEKEKLKRVTLDLPFSVYVDIRKKTVENEQTLRDYFINLAIEDLKS